MITNIATHGNGFFSSPLLLNCSFGFFGPLNFIQQFLFFSILLTKKLSNNKDYLLFNPIVLKRLQKNAYIDMNSFVNIVYFENDVFSKTREEMFSLFEISENEK